VLVDFVGHWLEVLVLPVDVSDRDGAVLLLHLDAARYPHLQLIWGDRHYGGDLITNIQATWGMDLVVVSKPEEPAGFVVLPRRWVVERSLGWLSHCRRLARAHEREPTYSEAWLHLAESHRLRKHLPPDPSLPVPYRRREAA